MEKASQCEDGITQREAYLLNVHVQRRKTTVDDDAPWYGFCAIYLHLVAPIRDCAVSVCINERLSTVWGERRGEIE